MSYAKTDAETIKQTLINRYHFAPDRVVHLSGTKATRSNILSTLRRLLLELKENDNLLIYYAGHGQLDPLTDNGYWIPVEGTAYDDTTWIRFATIKEYLSAPKVKAKNAILITDSCYGGALTGRAGPTLGHGGPKELGNEFYQQRLLLLSGKRSRQIIASGGYGVVPDRSEFARLFIQALQNNDYPLMDLEYLFYTQVYPYLTATGLQDPRMVRLIYGPEHEGQFTLLKKEEHSLETGQVIQDRLFDGRAGPKMVFIKGGCFQMGSPIDEKGRLGDEILHKVCVDDFYIGQYEVTFDEYDRFVDAMNVRIPSDWTWGRGSQPVIDVSWEDAGAYNKWLSTQTGESYRLPTEAEWEYAARAGSKTAYWWGNNWGKNNANCDGCGSEWDDQQTAPVGSFKFNPWGLYDTSGNVYEWVQDCYDKYDVGVVNNPTSPTECKTHVLRGGGWRSYVGDVRSALRYHDVPDARYYAIGLRLARDLNTNQ